MKNIETSPSNLFWWSAPALGLEHNPAKQSPANKALYLLHTTPSQHRWDLSVTQGPGSAIRCPDFVFLYGAVTFTRTLPSILEPRWKEDGNRAVDQASLLKTQGWEVRTQGSMKRVASTAFNFSSSARN